jgi:signal peptidase II
VNRRRFLMLALAAATVAIDELIKAWAVANLPSDASGTFPPIALAVHRNFGIAFDLPFRMPLIVTVSAVIGFFLIIMAWKSRVRRPATSFFAILILVGAVGNLFDRLLYGFTVDYLLIFGRLAINLCDLLIVAGVLGILMDGRKLGSSPVDAQDLTNAKI